MADRSGGAPATHRRSVFLQGVLPLDKSTIAAQALLDRYGLTGLFGQDAIFPTLSDAVAAFRAAPATGGGTDRADAPEDTPPP